MRAKQNNQFSIMHGLVYRLKMGTLQDGDWTKQDKISMEDETTSIYFLVIIWLWLYILAKINTFSQIKKDAKHNLQCICIKH